MKEIEIKNNYFYLEFDTDSLMFEKLDEFLNDGYQITDSVFLCVEVSKNNVFYLLSYLKIADVDEHIKHTILSLYQPREIVYPNYQNTLLNVIASIRKNFGYSSDYPVVEDLFDKSYRQVILLVLDGLGLNILENNLDKDSFLRKHLYTSFLSIYPSTTAASTTSIKSGRSPISTGWTGWANYIKEANKEVILFQGKDYYTGENLGISGFDILPYDMFYNDMKVKGYCIEPDFTKENLDFKKMLKRSIKINKQKEKSIQYVYFTNPDYTMHEYGAYSKEAKEVCQFLDKEVEDYAGKLSSDTLLMITADHGHKDVSPIQFHTCQPLLRLLKRRPSNDSRCIVFSVLDDKHKEFEIIFNALFGSIYQLYKTKDAIEQGFFGKKGESIHPRCGDFLGDYVAFGIHDYYFNYQGNDKMVFKSHHAGITKEEMIVPLCVIRR